MIDENGNNLELRMYGLVPYNLSPIQQGIQFGHSVVEYSLINNYIPQYFEWAKDWKTFIILNGGTTNNISPESYGTLNKHLQILFDNDINLSCFEEPDLGDQLTAITFIVDERVFNYEKYPDFKDYITQERSTFYYNESEKDYYKSGPSKPFNPKEYFNSFYQEWLILIGGSKNEFLREFLKQFRLA